MLFHEGNPVLEIKESPEGKVCFYYDQKQRVLISNPYNESSFKEENPTESDKRRFVEDVCTVFRGQKAYLILKSNNLLNF